ncbi:hypothetical protein GCM10027418_09670 [Mariniluteicoccus endophyticus]
MSTNHLFAPRRLAAGVLGAGILLGSLTSLVSPAEAGVRHDPRPGTSSARPAPDRPDGDGAARTPARSSTRSSSGATEGGTNRSTTTGSDTSAGDTSTGDNSDAGTGDTSGTLTGTDGLQPQTEVVLDEIRSRFPQVTDIGGVRADPLPDHPSGRALDLMIPDPTSAQGRALGDEIAAYLKENADRLDVSYVIWRQHIWSTQRASEGWRAMSDRGSATANHMDHVHVTVG